MPTAYLFRESISLWNSFPGGGCFSVPVIDRLSLIDSSRTGAMVYPCSSSENLLLLRDLIRSQDPGARFRKILINDLPNGSECHISFQRQTIFEFHSLDQ